MNLGGWVDNASGMKMINYVTYRHVLLQVSLLILFRDRCTVISRNMRRTCLALVHLEAARIPSLRL